MRYLFISGSIAPTYCGVGKFAAKELELLSRQNDITLGYLTNTTQAEKNDADTPLPEKVAIYTGELLTEGVADIQKAVAGFKPDIVNIQYQTYGRNIRDALFPRAVKKVSPKTKVIATIHEFAGYTAKGKLRLALAMWFADSVHFSDQQQCNAAKSFFFSMFSRRKFQVLISGQNIAEHLEEFVDPPMQPELQLGFHGYIQPQKGLHFLLEALERFEHPFKLHILGAFTPLLAYSEADEVAHYQAEQKQRIEKSPRLQESVVIHGDIEPGSKEFQSILSTVELLLFPFTDSLTVRRSSFSNSLVNSNSIVASTYKKGVSEEFLSSVLSIEANTESIVEFLKKYSGLSKDEKLSIAREQRKLREFLLSDTIEVQTLKQLLLN